MEYFCIVSQADTQQFQQSSSIHNDRPSAQSSCEYSRSPYLADAHQNHEPFRGIPITIAPSRSHRRRKRKPLNPASKRQRTGDQETCSDDIRYNHVNSPIVSEGQVPDEQVHALAAPVNLPQIDGTFTPANMHGLFEYQSTGKFDLFDFPNTYLFDVFEHSSNLQTNNLDNMVCDFVSRIPSH